MPLQRLLESARGARLTAAEAKAVVVRVAAELGALHAGGAVHRGVSLAAVSLALGPGGTAAATLARAGDAARTDAARVHWGARQPGAAAHEAPEVAGCPADRAAHTPAADVWALGALLFALLAGGRAPFGPAGVRAPQGAAPPPVNATVDALQRWLEVRAPRRRLPPLPAPARARAPAPPWAARPLPRSPAAPSPASSAAAVAPPGPDPGRQPAQRRAGRRPRRPPGHAGAGV
jgi:DNA-binding helix-hairpin-helix protein with protein kinase domain